MLLPDAVRQFLQTRDCRNCRIDAAFSGGADSVALLHALWQLREEFGLDVRAIHIQHNLRGAESLRDEQFCRDFCEVLGIPLTVVSCDVQGYAEAHKLSVETAARECRYAAFSAHCSGAVATAHTASDNLETVLMRLTRGTGLKGMCGIPPARDQFLRPLLHVTRAQVEDYVNERIQQDHSIKCWFPEDWELDIRVLATGAKCAVLKHHLIHNEKRLSFRRMLAKKAYYSKSMAAYQAKWKGHPALKRQFGFFYRYFGVFVEHGKWRRLLRHPILAAVMYLERIAVGFTYLLSR